MATQVWVRNPHNYIRECLEADMTNVVFDYGILRKRSIDVNKFMGLHCGPDVQWRAMLVGEQGAMEVGPYNTADNPKAVYPVWDYSADTFRRLEELVAFPAGHNEDWCADEDLDVDQRPIRGQEHRVVIIRPPEANTSPGRAFYRILDEIQRDSPDCIIHLHGCYSYRVLFGLSYKSVDCEPRTLAAKGRVVLPSGKAVSPEVASEMPQWVNLLGMKPVDLKIPRNRCIFNIRSHMWAAVYFKDAIRFKTKGFETIDPDDPQRVVHQNNRIMLKNLRKEIMAGEKFLCNTCSLQDNCKFYRDGAVCIVPGSEAVDLAKLFNTRDSDSIIAGLGGLMETQSRRLSKALHVEAEDDELNPEVTKIINTMFANGVKLAKVVDPRLAAAGAAKISLTQTNNTIQASTPQALMAGILEEFERRGIPRSSVTPEMVKSLLVTPEEDRMAAIEAAVVDVKGG